MHVVWLKITIEMLHKFQRISVIYTMSNLLSKTWPDVPKFSRHFRILNIYMTLKFCRIFKVSSTLILIRFLKVLLILWIYKLQQIWTEIIRQVSFMPSDGT
jgi:hypothetical protein